MRRILVPLITLLFLSSCTFAWRAYHAAAGVEKITKEEARALLDDPEVTIIDVRDTADWEGSGHKVPGAVREDPYDVASWVGSYAKDRRIVLYCA